MITKPIALSSIPHDHHVQSRQLIDYTVVAEYAEAMKAGATFPPIVLYFDGTDYWLADGIHRLTAAHSANVNPIEADVRTGTRDEAVWHACGANKAHGMRRTNDDKRRAVEMALKLKPEASDRVVAEHCGVSPTMVGTVRAKVAPQVSNLDTSTKRTGKDGKAYGAKVKPRGKAPATVPPSQSQVQVAVQAEAATATSTATARVPPDASPPWVTDLQRLVEDMRRHISAAFSRAEQIDAICAAHEATVASPALLTSRSMVVAIRTTADRVLRTMEGGA